MGSHGIEKVAQMLGRAVRRRRRELGLTQRELSLLAGCGVVFLYELEQGKATVQLDKLLGVLEVLGLRLRLEVGTGPLHIEEDARMRGDEGDG